MELRLQLHDEAGEQAVHGEAGPHSVSISSMVRPGWGGGEGETLRSGSLLGKVLQEKTLPLERRVAVGRKPVGSKQDGLALDAFAAL